MTTRRSPADDRSMPLGSTLAWLVDAAAETPTPELFLATLGQRADRGWRAARRRRAHAGVAPPADRPTHLAVASREQRCGRGPRLRGRSAFGDCERMVQPGEPAGAGLQGLAGGPVHEDRCRADPGRAKARLGRAASVHARTRPKACARRRASRRRRSPRSPRAPR